MDIGKVLLVYLCMAIAVSFFFPQTVLDPDRQISILGIFDVSYNSTTKEVFLGDSSTFKDADLASEVNVDNTDKGLFGNIVQAASQVFQSFIDGLKNVLGTIKILFKFLFSPIIFIADPNLLGAAPTFVKMIIALPLIFIGLIAIVKFISGRISG